MHIHTKYEVSILNPVARGAVHRCQCQCWMMPDDNYAQRTNHDYIGSFGRIPNEPKTSSDTPPIKEPCLPSGRHSDRAVINTMRGKC